MSDPEVQGFKEEIARLRKENYALRETVDELKCMLSDARQLCTQLTKILSGTAITRG